MGHRAPHGGRRSAVQACKPQREPWLAWNYYWEPPHPDFGLQFRASLQQVAQIVVAAAAGLTTVANRMALCWFGMWMGMTSRSANLATLKTILFVQVIPSFVIAFGTNMVVGW
jgi:hypothetical protein